MGSDPGSGENGGESMSHHASERGEMAYRGIVSGQSDIGSHLSKCAECGASYARLVKHQTFCSARCRKASWEKERKIRPSFDVRQKLGDILARLERLEKHFGIGKGE